MPSSFGNLALSRASAARRADGSGRGWGAKFNRARSDANVVLKLGLYAGSCIAVTAGGVLDYFGSTVNTAARLEHQCRSGEVVVSDAVLADDQARGARWPCHDARFERPVGFVRIPPPESDGPALTAKTS